MFFCGWSYNGRSLLVAGTYRFSGERLPIDVWFCSQSSLRVKCLESGALHDDPCYKDFVIEVEPGDDLRMYSGPRTTSSAYNHRRKSIWTTFSEDKLMWTTITLMFCNAYGGGVARLYTRGIHCRLDAVAFLWKESWKPIACTILNPMPSYGFCLDPWISFSSAFCHETNVPHPWQPFLFWECHDEAEHGV